MPIEYVLLKDKPIPQSHCPYCGAIPFEPFLRGTIQRSKFHLGKRRNYCALICSNCKAVVGYEAPPWNSKCWLEKHYLDDLCGWVLILGLIMLLASVIILLNV
jgi:hypothetical protein